MKIIRAFGYCIAASFVLGSGGFIGWILLDWLLFKRPFWPADILFSWSLAVLVTAIFLTLICVPLQLLARRFNAVVIVLASLLSGPFFVWILLILRGEPFTARNYIYAPGVIQLHVLFFIIGVLFSIFFKYFYPKEQQE